MEPFIATLPVDVRLPPATVDPCAFVVQPLDEAAGQWKPVKRFFTYAAASGAVRFHTDHFSTWRVKYTETDESLDAILYTFYTGNFAIH